MSREIATWSMIRSKIFSFPAPTLGRENECLTKSEIVNMGGAKVNGSYGDSECVVIDDIEIGYIYPLETNFATNSTGTVTVNLSEYVSKMAIVWMQAIDTSQFINLVLNTGDRYVRVHMVSFSFTGTTLLIHFNGVYVGSEFIIKINIEEREYTLNINITSY